MSHVACTVQISEGRDAAVVDAIVSAIRSLEGVRVLDRVLEPEQNRAAITVAAGARVIGEAAFQLVRAALEHIDLERHQGGHPRIGAVDELAFFPLDGVSVEDCVRLAREVGERIGNELELPIYFGDEAATRPELRRVAALRHIGFEGLRAAEGGEGWVEPDAGPRDRLHPRGGATIVLARPALTLIEVELASVEMAVARRIVDGLRRDPSFSPMRMAATALAEEGWVAVNVEVRDPSRVGLARITERIGALATENGTSMRTLRIEGLVPLAAVPEAADPAVPLVDFEPERQVYERLLATSA